MAMHSAVCLFLLIAMTINAQNQTINLRGKVTGTGDTPVSGAIVTLVNQDLSDTTGSDGMYEITQTTDVIAVQELQPEYKNFIVEKGALVFSLPEATPLKIELFDVKGNLLKREAMSSVPKGFYRFGIAENLRAARVLIIRVVMGSDAKTFRYLPLKNGSYVIDQIPSGTAPAQGSRLMKIAAINDTLKITANGYKEKKQAIVSYDQEMNVTLEVESSSSDTGRSVGCGKELGSINKSGTYHISSAGGRGDYIVDIPTNYDKDKPYRLIFGMHCMGGSAVKVAGTDGGRDQTAYYYHVKTQADKDNIQCIYVAPQGDGGGTWSASNDPKFFSDILKTMKDNLCIDTTRVFVCGFSFGAMFSYALSLAYPEQIRAVACYAPANWNFNPQPTNRHIPIAYYQTTGTSDGTCKWINNDGNKTGGKYCLLQHAEDNGCTTSGEIKLANSGTHVVTEFQGCDEGYPVKFSSFQGGHQCNATDAGTNFDWIPVETWEFFKQF
ncbi:MAG: hypothetical protein JW863_13780 [Chitinispirillaceae bacterium]|nr:hypothetical protein [Chitinispirillaceae bacterium]